MSKLAVFVILLSFTACRHDNAANEELSIRNLTRIVGKQDFTAFIKLSRSLDYRPADSFGKIVPFVMYTTSEPVKDGNTLSSFYDRYNSLFVEFSTYRVDLYEEMRKQLGKAGFVEKMHTTTRVTCVFI